MNRRTHRIISIFFLLTLTSGLVFADDRDLDGINDLLESQLAEYFRPVIHKHYLDVQEDLADVVGTVKDYGKIVMDFTYFDNAHNREEYDIYDSYGFDIVDDVFHLPFGYFGDASNGELSGVSGSFHTWWVDIDDDSRHGGAPHGSRPVYYHVRKEYPTGTRYFVQYWFFLRMNDLRENSLEGWIHEGEWEHIEVAFDMQSSVFDSTQITVHEVQFYKHYGATSKAASDCWWSATPEHAVPLDGQYGFNYSSAHHIHVWLARNGHASFNRWEDVLKSNDPTNNNVENYRDDPDYGNWNPYFFGYDYLVKMGEYREYFDYTHNGRLYSRINLPTLEENTFLSFEGRFGDENFSKIDYFFHYQETPPPSSPITHVSWDRWNEDNEWGLDEHHWVGDGGNWPDYYLINNYADDIIYKNAGPIVLSDDLYVSDKVELVISDGTQATIPAGTVITLKGDEASFRVEGTGSLTIEGTAASPVIFKHIDETGTGKWEGIVFEGTGNSQLSYVNIQNADVAIQNNGHYSSSSYHVSGLVSLDHVTVSDCNTALGIGDGARTGLSNSVLTDCDIGIENGNVSGELYLQNSSIMGMNTGINLIGSDNINISGLYISGCTTGIKNLMDGGDTEIASSTITNCGTGVYIGNENETRVQGSTISNCDAGIYATDLSSQGADGLLWLQDTQVLNSTNNGVELSTLDEAFIWGLQVKGSGKKGLCANYVDILEMGTSTADIFRNNGANGSYQYDAAVTINQTAVTKFKNIHIVDNERSGLRLLYNANLPSSTTYHTNIELINNVRGVPTSQPYYNRYELYSSNNIVGLGNRHYNIYNTVANLQYKLILAYQSNPVDMTNIFWNWGIVTDHSGINAKIYAPYVGDFTVVPASPTAFNYYDGAYYWASTDKEDPDDPGVILARAYELIDDPETLDDSIELFRGLVSQGYSPAISGLSTALRRKGVKASEAIKLLRKTFPANLKHRFDVDREFNIGNILLHYGMYDEAIAHFRQYAESNADTKDSLCALIETVEIERMKLLADVWNSDNHRSEKTAASLGRLEQRKSELYSQLGGEFEKTDKDIAASIPTEYALSQAFPNPFNASAIIPFSLPETSDVRIEVYNSLGQRIATLVNRSMRAGHHEITWHGIDNHGSSVSSGIYFVKMVAGKYSGIQKIVMMK